MRHFNYLGCDISYEKDNEVDNKLAKFRNVCGTIHKYLKHKARKDSRLKFYKTIAVPILIYGSEAWALSKRGESKMQSSKMLFLRSVKSCYRIDRIENDILQELNIFTIKDKIKDNKVRWCQHLNRMSEDRLPVKANQYRPTGNRDLGRPSKRWVPVQA
jgi:hypothetical protein